MGKAMKKHILIWVLAAAHAALLAACARTPSLSIRLPEAYQSARQDGAGAYTQSADPDTEEYAFFSWSGFSYSVPERTGQVLLIASRENEANFMLLEKNGASWSLILGPRFCITDGKVPAGLMRLGEPTGNKDAQGCILPCYTMQQDSSTGESGLYIYGANTSPAAASGGVAIGQTDFLTLLAALDGLNDPLVLIVTADSYGWKIEAGMPEDFVYLTDAVPGIMEDARYATVNNFTGEPLPGYYGARVVVSAAVARGLEKAQEALQEQGLGLLVYDGYRPQRAVKKIMEWLEESEDASLKSVHYPRIDKSQIKALGYLVDPSPHSRGVSVDVTIVDKKTGLPLDMGGDFDLFDASSSYQSSEITDAQRENRRLLRDTMLEAGFTPYDVEWWHFNMDYDKTPVVYFDFAIAM